MAVSMSHVLGYLKSDEPTYELAAKTLGTAAIPHLIKLIKGDDTSLAAKAASLAGFLASDRAVEAITLAAKDSRRNVRVAAAASLARLPSVPQNLVDTLLADPEAGVRKWALKSLDAARPLGMKNRVKLIADSDPEPALRQLAKKIGPRLS